MAGGLLQLAGYGNQDIYLTGSPLISYFKVVYRRYTNFSMENIHLPADNNSSVELDRQALNISINFYKIFFITFI